MTLLLEEKTIPTTSRPVADVLRIDAAQEVDRIAHMIRDVVLKQFKRKGAVVGVSGGIDSSVVAALCTYALGKDRVIALFMPETESAAENLVLGRMLTESLGIAAVTEDIAPFWKAPVVIAAGTKRSAA